MQPTSAEAQRLVAAIETLPVESFERVVKVSHLTSDDRSSIADALSGAGPVASIVERLLDRWDDLSPAERTAALLALAEALAS